LKALKMAEETSQTLSKDPKWVQMCEGVRKNDQRALEELFQIVKRMSWPLSDGEAKSVNS
jgi:hypothetical protein